MVERYRVVIEPEAIAGMEQGYRWILGSSQSKEIADGWIDGLAAAIQSLDTFPKRCPRAAEAEILGEDVRVLVHGSRNSAYLVYFTVSLDEVHVLHIRHSARQWYFEPDA